MSAEEYPVEEYKNHSSPKNGIVPRRAERGMGKAHPKEEGQMVLTPPPEGDRGAPPGNDHSPHAPPSSGRAPSPFPSRPQPQKPSDVKELLSRHARLFQERLGEPFLISWGKDGATMKSLLRVYTREQIEALQDAYFKLPDSSFPAKAGLTVGLFLREVPALITRRTKAKPRLPELKGGKVEMFYGGKPPSAV